MRDFAIPLDAYTFELPEELIAQTPVRPRDASRLCALTAEGQLEHRVFHDLPDLLAPGDLVVLNTTKVMPARLHVRRDTGGRVELLPYHPRDGRVEEARHWECLGRPGKVLQPGVILHADDGTELVVLNRRDDVVEVRGDKALWDLMCSYGRVPLPPYVRRRTHRSGDAMDYQSIFARELGAVAAPTASLHFTDRVFQALRRRGIGVAEVVLHVGPGTFLPIRREYAEDVRQHAMHEETYWVPEETQRAVEATRRAGRRVVAAGTTVVRALETWAQQGRDSGRSSLFIYEGFRFCVTDAMVTNFHLPRSTLLLLVAAFVGRSRILSLYAEAIVRRYRFFSFGDAMLLHHMPGAVC